MTTQEILDAGEIVLARLEREVADAMRRAREAISCLPEIPAPERAAAARAARKAAA
jgi:hypothetical protein